jgi:hypothetical protein
VVATAAEGSLNSGRQSSAESREAGGAARWKRHAARCALSVILLALAWSATGAYGQLMRWRQAGKTRVEAAVGLARLSHKAPSVWGLTNLTINGVDVNFSFVEQAEAGARYRELLEQAKKDGWLRADDGSDAGEPEWDGQAVMLTREHEARWFVVKNLSDRAMMADLTMPHAADHPVLTGAPWTSQTDAPGGDIEGVPRPENSVRMSVMRWDGGALAAYASDTGAVNSDVQHSMRKYGWGSVLPANNPGELLWYYKDQRECMIWVGGRTLDEKTLVMILTLDG